jgi:DnaJ family protein C protein 27
MEEAEAQHRNRERRTLCRNLPKPNIIRIKVISMGESEVGKSCLIKRYCEEKFVNRYLSTIGVDFGVKRVTIDNVEMRVNFFDLSGHPEFFEVRNEFYKDCQGALLVYDIHSRSSFDKLDSWLLESSKYGAKNIVIAVCGNKKDSDMNRIVTEKDGRDWAAKNGCLFFETSAQTGENVKEVFDTLFRHMYEAIYNS